MHVREEHVVGPSGPIPVQFPKSVFLNGNAVVIDLDFETLRLLPILVNPIAQYDDGDPQNAADEV